MTCGSPCHYKASQCSACANPRAERGPGERMFTGGGDRAQFGCIASFESASGERLTLHETGPPTKALSDMCRAALAKDPSFKLASYSTPDSILADLEGRRTMIVDAKGLLQKRQNPEASMLSRVGLSHMLHPRLGGMAA